jgi:hypothetical protein
MMKVIMGEIYPGCAVSHRFATNKA